MLRRIVQDMVESLFDRLAGRLPPPFGITFRYLFPRGKAETAHGARRDKVTAITLYISEKAASRVTFLLKL